MKKECKVIMLELGNKPEVGDLVYISGALESIGILEEYKDNNSIYVKVPGGTQITTDRNCKLQHLYIVSDENIKVGDIVICHDELYPQTPLAVSRVEFNYGDNIAWCNDPELSNYNYQYFCKKVIYTTNTKCNLPNIPEGFINEYVQAQGEIDTVLVDIKDVNEIINMVDKRKNIKAKAAHDIWAYWMKYMFTQGKFDELGNWIMPKHKVERWQRQMDTGFWDLPETERESDYDIAEKFMNF
jgi:hypothetical protein